jgi:hypothetical protein
MAWQLVAEVLEQCPDIPYREFRVLMAIAHRAPHDTRRCSPGLDEIAALANCAPRTVSRNLRKLIDRDLITLVAHGNRHKSSVYELAKMPALQTPTPMASLEGPPRALQPPLPVASVDSELQPPLPVASLESTAATDVSSVDDGATAATDVSSVEDLQTPLTDLQPPIPVSHPNEDTLNEPPPPSSDGSLEGTPPEPPQTIPSEPTQAQLDKWAQDPPF